VLWCGVTDCQSKDIWWWCWLRDITARKH